MNEDQKLLRKLLREHYEKAAATGLDFSLDEVVAAATADPAIEALAAATHAEACLSGLRQIDKHRSKQDEQGELFGDAEQVIALPGNRRRRKGSCRVQEVLSHLGYVSSNAARVNAAASREQSAAGLLMPYLSAGATWEEAVVEYAADHPDESA